MTDDFGRAGWERRWTQVLEADAPAADRRVPNPSLLAEAAHLPAGVALDAGAGHGSEALWLAARGWRVTAVDFSATALAHARTRAERAGVDVAGRIDWVEGDLGDWTPPPAAFDLVTCLYVHVAGSVTAMVRRLAGGVAPGGRLLLVGRPGAVGQTQLTVDDALEALDEEWEILVAEDRGADAVVRARRRL
ncbi:class I SAM-dependent methyltransferase [Actinomycetospora aeridis]|uniref:Class I SAM-dependent methyltransferase n=1 Tax=Actinomycetospora aeridis TaxID=3129231 RepID=A0ABU8NEP1_9PSEU